VVKAVVAGVSLILLASMGGGFVALPLLVPPHIWAARRSGATGRVLWSLLPVATAIVCTWAIIYVLVGEAQPAIWLIAAVAGALTAEDMRRTTVRHHDVRAGRVT
jgi:hypothetical protein